MVLFHASCRAPGTGPSAVPPSEPVAGESTFGPFRIGERTKFRNRFIGAAGHHRGYAGTARLLNSNILHTAEYADIRSNLCIPEEIPRQRALSAAGMGGHIPKAPALVYLAIGEEDSYTAFMNDRG